MGARSAQHRPPISRRAQEDRITPRVTPNLTDGQSPSCSGILTPFSSAKHISSQVLQACVDELAQEAGEAQEAKGAEEASEEDSRASTVIMAAPVSTVLCTVGLLRWDSRLASCRHVVAGQPNRARHHNGGGGCPPCRGGHVAARVALWFDCQLVILASTSMCSKLQRLSPARGRARPKLRAMVRATTTHATHTVSQLHGQHRA